MITWCAAIGSVVALLCFGHYASVTWPSIAYRPEIARTLRLDRPDSFGRWVTCALLAGSAGISLLIYQLRRHKNDDFRGHYRLWRLVLVVLLLASVDALVSLVDWTGALLDAGFGKRVALSGNDWIRIVLSVGGAVLALRLTVEVRRSRWALATIVMAWAVLAFPVAARWNVLTVDTMSRWVLVTAAPLLGSALIFVSLGGYLRLLYREVRKIDDALSIADRLAEIRLRLFTPHQGASDDVDETTPGVRQRKRRADRKRAEREVADEKEDVRHHQGWFGRRRKHRIQRPSEQTPARDDEQDRHEDAEAEAAREPRPKRGWFGLKRKTKAKVDPTGDVDESEAPESPKRSRFSMRPQAETQAVFAR